MKWVDQFDIEELSSAIEHSYKAEKIAMKVSHSSLIRQTWDYRAESFIKLQAFGSLLVMVREINALGMKKGLRFLLADAAYFHGLYYYFTKQYKKGLSQQLEAFVNYEYEGEKVGMMRALNSMAHSSYMIKEFEDMLDYSKRAYDLAKDLNSDYLYEVYKSLARANGALGNYKESLKYYHLRLDYILENKGQSNVLQ